VRLFRKFTQLRGLAEDEPPQENLRKTSEEERKMNCKLTQLRGLAGVFRKVDRSVPLQLPSKMGSGFNHISLKRVAGPGGPATAAISGRHSVLVSPVHKQLPL
jgi:hypothetical protein